MKLKDASSKQKLYGVYYTPRTAADFIIEWALNALSPSHILEPSCGNGTFIESILDFWEKNLLNNKFSCLGIEVDKEEARKVQLKFKKYSNIQIEQADFFKVYNLSLGDKKFDLIVGNPPYIRYQYLTAEQRESLSRILKSNGLRPNKLINAWVAFVVACVQLLAIKAKIGMVIPAELLQVTFAEELRNYLVDHLTKITLITFKELIFPNVQQEVLFFLGERDKRQEGCQIRIIQFENLSKIDSKLSQKFLNESLIDHNTDKWTKYFLDERELYFYKMLKSDTRFIPLKEFADVEVGITTGANKYFSVNNKIVEEFDLQEVTHPLIGRSSHTKGLYFTYEDWQENVSRNLDAYLITFPDIPYENYPEKHKEYIRLGEAQGIHKGYKCQIRDRWYIVPSVWIPDAFFLRRNYLFPKFVLNNINAVSTDTMHRVRFKKSIDPKKMLFAYYNSISIAFTEIEGRSHGGGVLELMPGEVEKLLLPNLELLPAKILEPLFNKIDHTLRENLEFEPILNEIDQRILVEYLGLHPIIPKIFRIIWKKLISRRLARSKKQKFPSSAYLEFYKNPENKKQIQILIDDYKKRVIKKPFQKRLDSFI